MKKWLWFAIYGIILGGVYLHHVHTHPVTADLDPVEIVPQSSEGPATPPRQPVTVEPVNLDTPANHP